MNSMIEFASRHLEGVRFAAFALDMALKSVVVLAVAAVLVQFWRRGSAATRHWIWFVAIASLVYLPWLSFPRPWQRSLWAVSADLNSANQFRLAIELAPPATTAIRVAPPHPETKATDANRSGKPKQSRLVETAYFHPRWLVAATVMWLAGAALSLLFMAVAQLRLRKIRRSAQIISSPDWNAVLQEVCSKLKIRRPVILMQSSGQMMPMTWGWRRPVVLLPAQSDGWPLERFKVVLWHELAHVKRWDCLTQMLARMVSALYWFNPLVWLATRRMRVERERACDDLVLNGGCKPSDYANHLVDIARCFRRVPQVAAITMARSSGLNQRVKAILDQQRTRNRLSKTAATLIALAAAAFAVFIGACTTTKKQTPQLWSLQQLGVAEQLQHFVAEKQAQATDGAKAEGKEMLPEYTAMFAAAAKADWPAISNIWEGLRMRAPQYEFPGPKDDRLHGTAWQTIGELWGAFGSIMVGGERVVAFGRDAIDSIPPGSIYLGGTDQGRFVITALQKSHVNADPFFTLSQNPLADGTYLAYIRRIYGAKIYTPTDEDSKKCFDEYIRDAGQRLKENKLKPGENVKMVEGKVQVSGQLAVMAINARLTKIIFDKNPDREFYLEESFPLDWMYPHLSPHGPIMKINRQPLAELSEETLQKDHEDWTRALKPMIGNWLKDETPVREVTQFAAKTFSTTPEMNIYYRSDAANNWVSKLRSSIAGVYAWRTGTTNNPVQQQRMLKEADFAFRQAYAVCPYSPEAIFRYINLLISIGRVDDALLVAETSQKIVPTSKQLRNLVAEVKKLQAAKKN